MVNDLEDPSIIGRADHTATSLTFENELKKLGYKNIRHYVSKSLVQYGQINSSKIGNKDFWIAQYLYNPDPICETAIANKTYGAWQWSPQLLISGINGYFDISADFTGIFTKVNSENPGPWLSKSGYATVTKKVNTWSGFNWGTKLSADQAYQQTYKINGMYHHSNGKTYYSLYDDQGIWQGYIDSLAVTLSDNPQRTWLSHNGYGTVIKRVDTLSNFSNGVKVSANDVYQQTLKVTGVYHHVNGTTYYSLYDEQNKWNGYIGAESVKLTTGAQGAWLSKSGHVTVSKADYDILSGFNGNCRFPARSVYQHTYKVNGMYHHINGLTYYSLYNDKNVWQGYINAEAVSVSSNSQGPWLSKSGYATVTKKTNTWGSFNWSVKLLSTQSYHHTFKINGMYHHSNGLTYYSLYDDKGVWQGYIDSSAVTLSDNAQGVWLSQSGYGTIVKKVGTSSNFDGNSKLSSDQVYQHTFKTTGVYYHVNGTTYYSLYDEKNKWYGYVDSDSLVLTTAAQGKWLSKSGYCTVVKKNYNTWSSFNWNVKLSSSSNYQQTYKVNGMYHHINGETYYSLYNDNDVWQGYINAEAVSFSK
ncbi:hypothetical protein FC84_GL001193 [Lapidilactobacillus dextrinicus DSM 20335]|uniref:Uncharacterized protein n=2 Tax=Lapidilactobacillus dextrinicus TaxID=51664 RepID=A0A0R2BGC0_9LACO|nr:hypothetical protein [Lapidilactobacillus dextrinicus]KRM78263.1 hypothetical protein FC84_GL001193 [Lapidilactobacillus dextrinicus DSM 20335]QFG47130.1 hypothetical protein LH506_06550 [Lapidilactobacillus dextrinicus]